MTSMFKKPKAYEPSAEAKELERRQAEEGREQKSELSTRKAALKNRSSGRRSLLTGSASGVPSKSTMG